MSKQTMPQTENKKRLRDIMSEAANGKQADQADMNAAVMGKMMKFLPIFMFFIMISIPGAIALYYGVSNIVAVLQQSYLLRQDTEEMEDIADEVKPAPKKATTKAREKAAQEATVTRIIAKPTRKGK
jgi:YidC/Oxa1 family membrane protein insertase